MANHLLLVDGSNLFARAFHTMREKSLAELPEKVRGMLVGAVRRWEPTHLVVALDTGVSFRRDAIAGYKADRDDRAGPSTREMTDALRPALASWRVAVREADGMEADDVIATLVRRAREIETPASILSKDSDLLQLVSDSARIRVLWPDGGEERVLDEPGVRSYLGGHRDIGAFFPPARILDLRVLAGGKDGLPRIEIRDGKPPFGFTIRRAAELLSRGATLAELLDPQSAQYTLWLNDRERGWIEEGRADALARLDALRLREDLHLASNGCNSAVGGLHLHLPYQPSRDIACKPTCLKCASPLDDTALMYGAEVCTPCGVKGQAPRSKERCLDCQGEIPFDAAFAGVNRCQADAMIAGRLETEQMRLERAKGRWGNVTEAGPHRYYLTGVHGEPGQRAVVDRQTGDLKGEGSWLNMWGLALRLNGIEVGAPARKGVGT